MLLASPSSVTTRQFNRVLLRSLLRPLHLQREKKTWTHYTLIEHKKRNSPCLATGTVLLSLLVIKNRLWVLSSFGVLNRPKRICVCKVSNYSENLQTFSGFFVKKFKQHRRNCIFIHNIPIYSLFIAVLPHRQSRWRPWLRAGREG